MRDEETLALIGHGRFGGAFAELARRQGEPLRVFDPGADVPGELRAPSLAAAVDGASIVVLAVPLDALAGVLTELAPLLAPAQLVVDTCSVKAEPERVLSRALDERVPWVATHPLFGPASLAEPDRALKVIVCPNPAFVDAAPRARALYERLGCQVHELDADAHDRLMAETQALAFFLGAGLRDAGLGAHEAWGPPSAEALARLAGGVTAEGGHLRATILSRNAHAASARARLLDALTLLDAALTGQATAPAASPASAALDELRQRIDQLDRRLLALLARRAEVARAISRVKQRSGRGVRDPAREEAAFSDRRRWAEQLGLDPGFVERVFEEILVWSRGVQEDERERGR